MPPPMIRHPPMASAHPHCGGWRWRQRSILAFGAKSLVKMFSWRCQHLSETCMTRVQLLQNRRLKSYLFTFCAGKLDTMTANTDSNRHTAIFIFWKNTKTYLLDSEWKAKYERCRLRRFQSQVVFSRTWNTITFSWCHLQKTVNPKHICDFRHACCFRLLLTRLYGWHTKPTKHPRKMTMRNDPLRCFNHQSSSLHHPWTE